MTSKANATILSGTVRVIAKGPWSGQVGVVDFVHWGNEQSTLYVDYPLVYVRFGNSKSIAFDPRELTSEQVDTSTLQEQAHD